MTCTWKQFIQFLSQEVDWNSEDRFLEVAPKIENIMRELGQNSTELKKRTEEIASDDQLFMSYAEHMQYPRQPMDKFVLYMDPTDRFRVRIHRFRTVVSNNAMIERRHVHKWPMHTLMLTGSYVEEQFSIDGYDKDHKAILNQTKRHELKQGGSNSLRTGVAHRIHNPSSTEPAITLFIRGKSFRDSATIFEDDGSPIVTYSLHEHLRRGLLSIGRLETDFH